MAGGNQEKKEYGVRGIVHRNRAAIIHRILASPSLFRFLEADCESETVCETV